MSFFFVEKEKKTKTKTKGYSILSNPENISKIKDTKLSMIIYYVQDNTDLVNKSRT